MILIVPMTSESARKKRKAKAKTEYRKGLKRLLTLRSGKTEHQDSKKAKSRQDTVKELVEKPESKDDAFEIKSAISKDAI